MRIKNTTDADAQQKQSLWELLLQHRYFLWKEA
jgi:hypothetical protein